MSWESLAPKDLGALDSCDKHRNDGSETLCLSNNLMVTQQVPPASHKPSADLGLRDLDPETFKADIVPLARRQQRD